MAALLNYSSDLVYWPLLRTLPEPFLATVKKFYIYHESALVETRFGEVFALGSEGLYLGPGSNTVKRVGEAVEIEELRGKRITEVELGSHHVMVLTESGDIFGWGRNQQGQLGTGDRDDQHRPVLVMKNVASVRCGAAHTAVIDHTGKVWAWGANSYGQVGRDDCYDLLQPTQLEGIEGRVVQLQCNVYNCVALTSDRSIYHWGKFYPVCHKYPKRAPLPANIHVASIASGQCNFLLVSTDGNVYCAHYPLHLPVFALKKLHPTEPIDSVVTHARVNLVCFVAAQTGAIHTASNGSTYSVSNRLTECSVPEVFAQYGRVPCTPNLTTLLGSATTPAMLRSIAYFNNRNESTKVIEVSGEHKIWINHKIAGKLSASLAKLSDQSHEDVIQVSSGHQYAVYLAYIRYLMTEWLVVEPDWAFELFTLANSAQECDLKNRCIEWISHHIDTDGHYIDRQYELPRQRLFVSRYLQATLNSDNVDSYFKLANEHEDEWLLEKVNDFLVETRSPRKSNNIPE